MGVPKGIKITIKSKIVEVTGNNGTLKRDFKHLPIELYLANSGHEVRARMYFAKSKQLSILNTVCSHISNLFDGVTKGFEYRMRLVYAHFPINATITNGGKTIELRNYLGEKRVRIVNMLPGVKVDKSTGSVKDELVIKGNDIDLTSRSSALACARRRIFESSLMVFTSARMELLTTEHDHEVCKATRTGSLSTSADQRMKE